MQLLQKSIKCLSVGHFQSGIRGAILKDVRKNEKRSQIVSGNETHRRRINDSDRLSPTTNLEENTQNKMKTATIVQHVENHTKSRKQSAKHLSLRSSQLNRPSWPLRRRRNHISPRHCVRSENRVQPRLPIVNQP